MMKWIEVTGKSEEAAVQSALEQLGLDRDSVSVEVLGRAKSGLFGLGRTPARVKVSYEIPDEEKPPQPVKTPQPESPPPVPRQPAAETISQPDSQAEPEEEAPEEKSPQLEEEIRAFLVGLLRHMGVEATPFIAPREEGGYLVTMEGEHLGALIGHRGETLDAIQQLTNYSVNRNRAHRVRIHIDAENYRSKREESLRRLARKVAAKVVKYRRNVTLEPMNAYERHVIHETLQNYPDVITYSTGTEPNRRTVVAFSRGKHTY